MNSVVIDTILKETARQPKNLEVPITRSVALKLKSQKSGLFQDQVDYRVLFPYFDPDETWVKKGRYIADLVGFNNNEFHLCEFKLYREDKRHHGVWRVMHDLFVDLLKLEAAIKANKKRLRGSASFVVGLRKSNENENLAQIKFMSDHWSTNSSKAPIVKGGDYYSTLLAFKRFVVKNKKWHSGWSIEEQWRGSTVFLIGTKVL